MHFIPSIVVLLALGIIPSFSFPTQAVKGSLSRLLILKDANLGIRDAVSNFGRREKNKATKLAAPSTTANAATATATTTATNQVIRIGEETSSKIKTNGFFGSPNSVQGGFLFTKLNMPANAVGNLEVEYNGTATNTILVAPRVVAIPPPTGMMYVDPLTFLVSTATPPAKCDTMKIDYIFTAAVKLAVDPAQVRVGKLDMSTKQFVTNGLGLFKFEQDENEWSQEVSDLNGEWGIFAPITALLPAKAA